MNGLFQLPVWNCHIVISCRRPCFRNGLGRLHSSWGQVWFDRCDWRPIGSLSIFWPILVLCREFRTLDYTWQVAIACPSIGSPRETEDIFLTTEWVCLWPCTTSCWRQYTIWNRNDWHLGHHLLMLAFGYLQSSKSSASLSKPISYYQLNSWNTYPFPRDEALACHPHLAQRHASWLPS